MGSVKYGIRSQSVGSINVHDSTVGLDLDIMSNKRARGTVNTIQFYRYQMYYLPCFAVDKNRLKWAPVGIFPRVAFCLAKCCIPDMERSKVTLLHGIIGSDIHNNYLQ